RDGGRLLAGISRRARSLVRAGRPRPPGKPAAAQLLDVSVGHELGENRVGDTHVVLSLCVEYLDMKRLARVTLDVKRFDVKLCPCLKTTSITCSRGSTTPARSSISRWRASSTASAASTSVS